MSWLREPEFRFPQSHLGLHGFTHAQVPTATTVDGDLRVFFTTRDRAGRSHIASIDIDAGSHKITGKASIELAPTGDGFERDGAMMGCLSGQPDRLHIHYTGWRQQSDRPPVMEIGHAIQEDDRFIRPSEEPVFGTSPNDSLFVSTPTVIQETDMTWSMYYSSGRECMEGTGTGDTTYDLRRATAKDGNTWVAPDRAALNLDDTEGGIVRPCFNPHPNQHDRGLVSIRSRSGFRGAGPGAYRLMDVRRAKDGSLRRGQFVTLRGQSDGWDADMQAYSSIVEWNGERWLLYNGNGFGIDGFGMARWSEGE